MATDWYPKFVPLLKHMLVDAFGMPVIRADHFVVKRTIGFNYAKSSEDHDFTLNFYLEDDQFERLWNRPLAYLKLLKKFRGAFSPDFSVYREFPRPYCQYQVFRNRFCGALWQAYGIHVIPTISWSTEDSYLYAFSGVERGADVTVSTVGLGKDEKAHELFRKGYREMIRIIQPRMVHLYGKNIGGLAGKKRLYEPYKFGGNGGLTKKEK